MRMVQCRMHQIDQTVTRRRLGLIFGSLGIPSVQAQTQKHGIIHFDVEYKTTPDRIYQALLDAKQFKAFSGLPAEIDPKPGGWFKLFDGHIEGRNIELVPNRRIVQAWRSGWPPGIYSIAKFELVASGSNTRIAFDHTGFPEGEQEHLASGWTEHYWEPLHKYLNA
jgi:activator of HSP90 ATPase